METAKKDIKKNDHRIADIIAKPEAMVALVLVLLCLLLIFLRPLSFPTPRNIFNVLRQSSLVAILAVGMGMVIITGGIDLSVGSVIAFSACMSMACYRAFAVPPIVVLFLALGGGLLMGTINGLLVSKLGIPPFIVTLGMLSVGNGAALVISNGNPIKYQASWVSVFGGGYIGLMPVTVLVMVFVLILGHIFANYTQTGRNIYAVGNSQQAAKLSGIFVDRVIITVYAITGFLAGLCGLILVGQMDSGDPSFGKGYELDVIAAAVIGGISMTGGEGNILGVLLGALLMGVLKNLFIQLAVSGYWQTIVLGLVIVGAVAIDCIRKKRAAR
ncbi:MAG: ABC transporter permease [Treponema sp.]|jgi:ribose transport system permease protein|nr:ABC transporter permease [Treponema sp.]